MKKMLRVVSLGICCMVIVLFPKQVYAAEMITEDERTYEFVGYGTQYDPYMIDSYEDICRLRDIVDSGDGLSDVYFKQTADILFPDGEVWNPIGDLAKGFSFDGRYNGNGHTISNVYCQDEYAGIFSFLSGEVRNLGIESGVFSGSCAGSITSHGTDSARITNCYNKADIMAKDRGGGIADNCPGSIMFCWNLGNISRLGDETIIAGICSYGEAQIEYCYDLNVGNLVDESTFSGNMRESTVLEDSEARHVMEQMYEGLWSIYSENQESSDNMDANTESVIISRGNTVFMRWGGGTVLFDSNYEPDIFLAEKSANKESFLNAYRDRFEFEGSGTQKDPFLITNFEDLSRLRDCVDIGITYRNYYFEQTADIFFPDNENWNPIGDLKKGMLFCGVYNGAGHLIYNINCNDPYAGLFSYLNGEVRNLGIESGRFTGDTVGSITSHGGENARIINCYNKAEVKGTYRAGGLADNYSGLLLFSWNLGKVTGNAADAILGSINSYGNGDIVYCFSTDRTEPVNGATFSGIIKNSGVIAEEDVEEVLKSTYSEYPAYIKNGTIDAEDIVFLRYDDGFVFDMDFSDQGIRLAGLMEFLPEIVLLFAGILLFVFGLPVIVRMKKPEEKQHISIGTASWTGLKNMKMNRTEVFHRMIALVLTIGVFVSGFTYVMGILNSKTVAGILNLDYWEKDENENTDILFLGSSTMSVNIELAELWKEYGIAGYCLGAGGMTMYDSYYRLIEAEKSHHTEMVIIDAKACVYSTEYSVYEMQTENVSGLKYSLNKLNFVRAAIAPEERLDYFLEFPLYHNRYSSISKWDFLHSSSLGEDDKGTWTVFYGNQYSPKLKSAKDVTEYRAIDEKEEYYLRKIIEYCDEHEIELLIIKTPDANREIDSTIFNTVGLIAEEYGVPFLDFNLYDEEIGLVSSDFYYDANHLNVTGARKCSDFLGDYLMANYNLDDHRGNEEYSSWDRFAANRENLYLSVMTDRDDYMEELKRDDKTVIAIPYKLSKEFLMENSTIMEQLSLLEYEMLEEDLLYGKENAKNISLGSNEIEIIKDYDKCVVHVNGQDEASISETGLMFIVYDEIIDKISVVAFNLSTEFELMHLY